MLKNNCLGIVKKLFILLTPSLFFVVLTSTVSAQMILPSDVTSTRINFQGKIVRNDAGYEGLNVKNGSPTCVQAGQDTCDFRVRYYDNDTGGTLLLTETFTNVEIGDYGGVFQLALGSGIVTTTSACRDGTCNDVVEVLSEYFSVYIELSFCPDGTETYAETFSRMPLNATPYSIHSRYAAAASDAFIFSSTISAGYLGAPAAGMVYFDPNDSVLKLYDGTQWVSLGEGSESVWKLGTVSATHDVFMSSSGIMTQSAFGYEDTVKRGWIWGDDVKTGFSVFSSYNSTGAWPLVSFKADGASFSGTILELNQKGTGNILFGYKNTNEVFRFDNAGDLHLSQDGILYFEPFASLPGSGNLSPGTGEGCVYSSGGNLYWDAACNASSPVVLNSTASGSLWTDAGSFTYLTATTDNIVLGGSTVETATFFFDVSGGSGSYFDINNNNNTQRLFTVLSNGNVGIGTAAPSAKLEIAGASSVISNTTGNITINPATFLEVTKPVSIGIDSSYNAILTIAGQVNGDHNFKQEFANDDWGLKPTWYTQRARGTLASKADVVDNDALMLFEVTGYQGSGYKTAARIYSSVDGVVGTNSVPGRVIFATTPVGGANPLERMVITSAGLVGIGTLTPDKKVHIYSAGDNYVVSDAPYANHAVFSLYSAGEQKGAIYRPLNTNDLRIWSGADAITVLNTNQNVGIGTTNPTEKLVVVGNATISRAFVTGLSSSWGVTSGVNTGGVNVTMGVSSGATWLISGTSGGTFRAGIQSYDPDGSLRIYSNSNFITISGSSLSAGTLTGTGLTAARLVYTGTGGVLGAATSGITAANVRSSVNGVTGTGNLVFATAPTFGTSIVSPIVTGSTAGNGTLTLRGNTAGVNTTTSINLSFNVGNSGATTAMTILNNANVNIVTGLLNVGSTGTATAMTRKLNVSDTQEYTMAHFRNLSTTNTSSGIIVEVRGWSATTNQLMTFYKGDIATASNHVGRIRYASSTTIAYATSGTGDFAEYMETDGPTEPGDILAFRGKEVLGIAHPNEELAGIHSTAPTFVANEINMSKQYNAPLAVSGIVPLKVNTSNGPIKEGDRITLSSSPGIGMKATNAGQIVARALEGYSNMNATDVGIIQVLVSLSWYDPTVAITEKGLSSSGWYRIAELNGENGHAKFKIDNMSIGSSQNMLISANMRDGVEHIDVLHNFNIGGYNITKARINNTNGKKYFEVYVGTTNSNTIKVSIENSHTGNWIATDIQKVGDETTSAKEFEIQGLLFGVSDIFTVSEENVRIGGTLLASSSGSSIGNSANRWNDIYTKGTIRLGSGSKEGGIRYNIEKGRLEFSNDGETWLEMGDFGAQMVLSPEYSGAILYADGTNNYGKMTSSAEDSSGTFKNYYQWISDRETLQHYDILVRFTLPNDFVSWNTQAISLDFMTENSATIENNKVEMSLMNSNGVEAELLNGISKLPGSWERITIKKDDILTCTEAGETCTLRVSMYSKENYFVRVGDISLNYNRGL
jgi:hypothetical protein